MFIAVVHMMVGRCHYLRVTVGLFEIDVSSWNLVEVVSLNLQSLPIIQN